MKNREKASSGWHSTKILETYLMCLSTKLKWTEQYTQLVATPSTPNVNALDIHPPFQHTQDTLIQGPQYTMDNKITWLKVPCTMSLR